MLSLISCTFVQSARCIVYSSLLGLCVAGSFVASIALAVEPPSITLETNQWEQLVIPGNAANITVRQLFTEELPAEDYGATWMLYLFDAIGGAYRNPGIDGFIPQGAGFWMIQTTNSPVTLNLLDNVPHAEIQNSNACSNTNGCIATPVSARASQSTYNLVGSALLEDTFVSEMRIRTQALPSACRNGCSLEEAADLGYVSSNLWHYDSSINAYRDLAVSGSISPWQSVWLQTLPAMQASEADILIPAPPEPPAACVTSSGFAGDDGLKRWCWSDLAAEINSLTGQSFIDNVKLFTSVHHYPDDTSNYLPVEVVDDQLVFTVTPRYPLNTSSSPSSGERSAWNYRSEIRDSPSNVDHPNGTEQWWGFNYTFSDDYIIDDLPWIMWQTHANESTPRAPMQALEVASTNYGGAGNVRGEIVVANNVYVASTGSTRLRTHVIPEAGQTLKVVIQLVWGEESTGLFRIWLDDVLVYDESERTSYPEHEEGGYWKAGIYKWRWQNERNIEISEALGITRLQTSMGSLRVIKNDPDDTPYLTDQYEVVDPAQDNSSSINANAILMNTIDQVERRAE